MLGYLDAFDPRGVIGVVLRVVNWVIGRGGGRRATGNDPDSHRECKLLAMQRLHQRLDSFQEAITLLYLVVISVEMNSTHL